MIVILNGNIVETSLGVTLESFLAQFGYSNRKIAVGINKVIISKKDFQGLVVNEYDEIDILIPMQGG